MNITFQPIFWEDGNNSVEFYSSFKRTFQVVEYESAHIASMLSQFDFLLFFSRFDKQLLKFAI